MITEFYAHLKEAAPDIACLYSVTSGFMHWGQIALIDDRTGWVLNVSHTSERKVYEHARYLVQELAVWSKKPVSITAQGMASQAMLLLTQTPNFKVTEDRPAGTLNGRKRNLATNYIVEYTS